MNVFKMSLAAGLLAAGSAQAGVLDFTDGSYGFDFDDLEFVGPNGVGVETKITERAAGVTFTITPRFQDGEPETWFGPDGLIFGPQGSPLTGLSIVPDQDVLLTSLEGRLLNPQFDFSFGPSLRVPQRPDAPSFASPFLREFPEFPTDLTALELFEGNYTLTAGSELFIGYFTDRSGDGRITRLFFDGATGGGGTPTDPVDPGIAPVPLPASAALLLVGLGGLAALRRATRRASAQA